jgi:putative flippase GtrA
MTLREFVRSDRAMRIRRYVAVSVVNTAVGECLLIGALWLLRWPAWGANVFAAALAAGPAYVMSRRWVWRMVGHSHFAGEVVPFWSLAFLGLALSSGAVVVAQHAALSAHVSRGWETLGVAVAALTAYGVVWVLRFFILDRFVFVRAGGDVEGVDERVMTEGVDGP